MRSMTWILIVVAGCARAESDPVPAAQDMTSEVMSQSSGEALQRMLAELAAARACQRLRGEMRALRANERPVATGTLWIRDCHATVEGRNVTFALRGSGWRWNEQARQVPTESFTVENYWRFDLN